MCIYGFEHYNLYAKEMLGSCAVLQWVIHFQNLIVYVEYTYCIKSIAEKKLGKAAQQRTGGDLRMDF